MAWTAPRTWVAGEIVTAALMNTHIRDNERYLKGLDGVPTIESGLTIDNTDGDERLLLPLLSTAECSTVLNAEGEVAFDEQTHQMKEYDGTAVRAIISEADVDDTPVDGATTVPVSSNWAYDLKAMLTTRGDIIRRGAADWERLALGTNGQYLQSDGTDAVWVDAAATKEFFIPCTDGTDAAGMSDFAGYLINANTEYARATFYVPHDFNSIVAAAVVMRSRAAATHRYDFTTDYGAVGEAYNMHSESASDVDIVQTVVISEYDFSGILSVLAAGDYVGIRITGKAINTPNCDILGIRFRYA